MPVGHFQLNALQDMQRLNALSITEENCRLCDRVRLAAKDVRGHCRGGASRCS